MTTVTLRNKLSLGNKITPQSKQTKSAINNSILSSRLNLNANIYSNLKNNQQSSFINSCINKHKQQTSRQVLSLSSTMPVHEGRMRSSGGSRNNSRNKSHNNNGTHQQLLRTARISSNFSTIKTSNLKSHRLKDQNHNNINNRSHKKKKSRIKQSYQDYIIANDDRNNKENCNNLINLNVSRNQKSVNKSSHNIKIKSSRGSINNNYDKGNYSIINNSKVSGKRNSVNQIKHSKDNKLRHKNKLVLLSGEDRQQLKILATIPNMLQKINYENQPKQKMRNNNSILNEKQFIELCLTTNDGNQYCRYDQQQQTHPNQHVYIHNNNKNPKVNSKQQQQLKDYTLQFYEQKLAELYEQLINEKQLRYHLQHIVETYILKKQQQQQS